MPGSDRRVTAKSLGSGTWFLTAVAGQLASVLLIRAGHAIGYQHYDLSALLHSPVRRVAVAVLVAQTVLVAAFGREMVRAMREWSVRNFTPLALALLVAFFVLTAATLSRDPRLFAGELVLASYV